MSSEIKEHCSRFGRVSPLGRMTLPCPFHEDPNFNMEVGDNGRAHCFVCDWTGEWINIKDSIIASSKDLPLEDLIGKTISSLWVDKYKKDSIQNIMFEDGSVLDITDLGCSLRSTSVRDPLDSLGSMVRDYTDESKFPGVYDATGRSRDAILTLVDAGRMMWCSAHGAEDGDTTLYARFLEKY